MVVWRQERDNKRCLDRARRGINISGPRNIVTPSDYSKWIRTCVLNGTFPWLASIMLDVYVNFERARGGGNVISWFNLRRF